MRQHAIPQNILDIEFKLFTKFTVREFVYMAIGIGFGGIFLYFFTLGQMPGIIAFPVFLISSGFGLFLGLVDINDQKADIFIKNYIWAISHPTQRVWKNKMIDDKIESVKPEFDVTQGTTSRVQDLPEAGSANIIGGTQDLPNNQFVAPATLDEIDIEEKKELERIDQIAKDTLGQQPQVPPQPSQPRPEISQPQEIPQTPPQQFLKLDKATVAQYKVDLTQPGPYAGNLNFKLVGPDDSPISQAVLVLKDQDGRVISAMQSDTNGEVLSNKFFPAGNYTIQAQSANVKFPEIQITIDQDGLLPIKIKSI